MLYGILLPLIVFSKSLSRNSVAHPSDMSGHVSSNNQPAPNSQLAKLIADAHRLNKPGKRGGLDADDGDSDDELRRSAAIWSLVLNQICASLELDNLPDNDRVAMTRGSRDDQRRQRQNLNRCLEDVLRKRSDGKEVLEIIKSDEGSQMSTGQKMRKLLLSKLMMASPADHQDSPARHTAATRSEEAD